MYTRQSWDAKIIAAATLVVALMATGVHGQPCGEWIVTPNPVFNGTEWRPLLIAAFGPDSAVAVDGPVAAGGLVRTTWDGTTWTAGVPEPLDLPTSHDVRAVAGTGPDDLWVCGLYTVNIWNSWPFLAHFDGQQWDVMAGTLDDLSNPNGGDPVRSGGGQFHRRAGARRRLGHRQR